MRRYHFHICDGIQVFDSLGTALADDGAAHDHAKKVASDLHRTKLFDKATAVRVTNDLGDVLFTHSIGRPRKRELGQNDRLDEALFFSWPRQIRSERSL